MRKQSLRNIVSMRVSDEEKSALEEMTLYSKMTVSEILREALQHFTPIVESRIRPLDRPPEDG